MHDDTANQTYHCIPTPFGTLAATLHLAKGQHPKGETVVVWPSLFSTWAVQHQLIDALSENRTVLAIDPPGHGASLINSASALTMQACAQAACDLVDVLCMQHPLWVGTSWGGLVGLEIARRNPARLTHLACLNTPFNSERSLFDRRNYLTLLARLVGTRMLFSNGVAKTFYLPSTRTDPQKAEAMRAHEETFTNGNAQGLAAAAKLIFKEAGDMRPSLSSINVPTLVIAGLHDQMYDLKDQRAAANALSNGRFIALNAAHIAAVDATEAVESALEAAWGT